MLRHTLISARLLLASLLLAFALLGGLAAASAPAAAQVAPVMQDLPLGKEDAPVTVIEYASLTCPHCADFMNNAFDQIKTAYIDTGKVKWIYRDFPLDQVALRAAMLARCAGPDRYYAFVETLFKQQKVWVQQKDPLQGIAAVGRLGGITQEQFDACMKNKDVENAALQNELDAQKQFGVDSTPTFIINGTKHAGELSLADFSALVDPLLAKAGN
jgi:protein-disulfide isomerase